VHENPPEQEVGPVQPIPPHCPQWVAPVVAAELVDEALVEELLALVEEEEALVEEDEALVEEEEAGLVELEEAGLVELEDAGLVLEVERVPAEA